MNNQLVTIYTAGDMLGSINKYEGKLVKCGLQRYAQYDNAPFVQFIPKGKRKAAGFVKGYKPFVLVLKGVGHPEPDDMFDAPKTSESGLTIRAAKYSAFSGGWETDFNAKIKDYLTPEMILLDVRESAGTKIVSE